MTYSIDFRRKALLIKEQEQLSFEATARRFGVAKSSIFRWSKPIEAQCTRHKPATKIDMEALKRDVEQYPDAYQYERAERLSVSRRGIGYALKRLGISRKKTVSPPQADIAARERFEENLKTYQDTHRQIIYLDESGFAHDRPRQQGYAPIGTRGIGKPNWHARGRINVIGALLVSCWLTVSWFTGAIHANTFSAWVAPDWLPQWPSNRVVVMDNAAFHQRADIRQRFEQAGHVLEYLPAYSPKLNPIEPKWAQAKAIRKQQPCSVEELFKHDVL